MGRHSASFAYMCRILFFTIYTNNKRERTYQNRAMADRGRAARIRQSTNPMKDLAQKISCPCVYTRHLLRPAEYARGKKRQTQKASIWWKTKMIHCALRLLFAGAIVLGAGAANAGARYDDQVRVYKYSDGSGVGYGSLGSARNSADGGQYLGCYSHSSSTLSYASCVAVDSSGSYLYCSTYNADMIALVRSVASDSYVVFSAGTTGACDSVGVANRSYNAPKNP